MTTNEEQIARAEEMTRCGCNYNSGPEQECGKHGDEWSKMVADLADRLAALTTPQEAESIAETKRTLDAIFGVERAEPTPQEAAPVCAWCPLPARGDAWHNDGKLHPSCGQIGHGQGWVPPYLAPVAKPCGESDDDIRGRLSELLFTIYDHGTQPNALREADAIIAALPVLSRTTSPDAATEEMIDLAVDAGMDLIAWSMFEDERVPEDAETAARGAIAHLLAALDGAPEPEWDSTTIPRPVVPFGPHGVPENDATADYLLGVIRKIDEGYAVIGGSNVTATVRKLLAEVGLALRALPVGGESR